MNDDATRTKLRAIEADLQGYLQVLERDPGIAADVDPASVRQSLEDVAALLREAGPRRFAELAWTAEDVTGTYDVTDEEAETFLAEHERRFRDRLCELGNQVLDDLAALAGLPPADDDLDSTASGAEIPVEVGLVETELDVRDDEPNSERQRPAPRYDDDLVKCAKCGGENLHYVETIGCGRQVLERAGERLIVEGYYVTAGYDEGAADPHLLCRDCGCEMAAPGEDEIEFV